MAEANEPSVVVSPEWMERAYQELAKRTLLAAVPRTDRGQDVDAFVRKLRAYGLDTTPRKLRQRINDGRFPLAFAAQCLAACGISSVPVATFEEARALAIELMRKDLASRLPEG
jgi:hypothetical protein